MISQTIIDEFHRREFGEEMARVNALPRAERWAYVRQLWERAKLAEARGSVRRRHGPERIWGELEFEDSDQQLRNVMTTETVAELAENE